MRVYIQIMIGTSMSCITDDEVSVLPVCVSMTHQS